MGLTLGCSAPQDPPKAPKPEAERGRAFELRYDARFDPDRGEILMRAQLGRHGPFDVHPRARPFVVDRRDTDDGTITYRFLVDDAVDELAGEFGTERQGDLRVLSSTFWLMRPDDLSRMTYHLDMQMPKGIDFALGSSGSNAFALDSPAMAIFGPIAVHDVRGLRVVIAPGRYAVADEMILDWATEAASGVVEYFGEVPTERGLVLLIPCDERYGPHHGFALGYRGGASVRVHVGRGATHRNLRHDWSLTHEMIHLGFPNMPRHAWLEEGLATYLEPLIRARRDRLTEEQLWMEMLNGLANAVDHRGRVGFAPPIGWGDIYWGGALLFLLADLEIRRRTDNRQTLDDALRALHDSGDIRIARKARDAMQIADAATGGSELTTLYDQLSRERRPFDLRALYRRLGVFRRGDTILFDDEAPDAHLRKALLR